jgi:hypothetical protein
MYAGKGQEAIYLEIFLALLHVQFTSDFSIPVTVIVDKV